LTFAKTKLVDSVLGVDIFSTGRPVDDHVLSLGTVTLEG